MLQAVRFLLFAYAALLIVGGLLGGAKGSVVSIVAGVVCGLLALGGGIVLPGKPRVGLILGIVATVLVLGGQLPRFLKAEQKKLWPGGATIAASVVTLLLAGAALATSGKDAGAS